MCNFLYAITGITFEIQVGIAVLSIMGVLPSSPWLHFQNEGKTLNGLTWDPLRSEVGSSWKIVRGSQLGPTCITHGKTHLGPMWAPRTKHSGSHLGCPCGTHLAAHLGPKWGPYGIPVGGVTFFGQCLAHIWVNSSILSPHIRVKVGISHPPLGFQMDNAVVFPFSINFSSDHNYF